MYLKPHQRELINFFQDFKVDDTEEKVNQAKKIAQSENPRGTAASVPADPHDSKESRRPNSSVIDFDISNIDE